MSFVGLSHFNRFDGLGRFGRFYGFDDSLRLFDRLRRLNLGFHLFQNFDRNLRKRFALTTGTGAGVTTAGTSAGAAFVGTFVSI